MGYNKMHIALFVNITAHSRKVAFLADASAKGGGGVDPLSLENASFFLKIKNMP